MKPLFAAFARRWTGAVPAAGSRRYAINASMFGCVRVSSENAGISLLPLRSVLWNCSARISLGYVIRSRSGPWHPMRVARRHSAHAGVRTGIVRLRAVRDLGLRRPPLGIAIRRALCPVWSGHAGHLPSRHSDRSPWSTGSSQRPSLGHRAGSSSCPTTVPRWSCAPRRPL